LLPPWLIVAFVATMVDCCLCCCRSWLLLLLLPCWLLPLLPPWLIVAFVAATLIVAFVAAAVDCCQNLAKECGILVRFRCRCRLIFQLFCGTATATLAMAVWLFSRFLPGSSVGHYHFCFRTNVMPPLQLACSGCMQRQHGDVGDWPQPPQSKNVIITTLCLMHFLQLSRQGCFLILTLPLGLAILHSKVDYFYMADH